MPALIDQYDDICNEHARKLSAATQKLAAAAAARESAREPRFGDTEAQSRRRRGETEVAFRKAFRDAQVVRREWNRVAKDLADEAKGRVGLALDGDDATHAASHAAFVRDLLGDAPVSRYAGELRSCLRGGHRGTIAGALAAIEARLRQTTDAAGGKVSWPEDAGDAPSLINEAKGLLRDRTSDRVDAKRVETFVVASRLSATMRQCQDPEPDPEPIPAGRNQFTGELVDADGNPLPPRPHALRADGEPLTTHDGRPKVAWPMRPEESPPTG